MMEEFFPWEEKHGLIGDTLEGFAYWNYMRRDMYKSFRDDMDGILSPFFRNLNESDEKKSFSKRLGIAFDMLKMPGKSRKRNIDVLFICHSRRTEIDGKLVSVYTDFLTDYFPDSVTIERAGSGRPKGTPYTPELVYLDRLELLSNIYLMGVRLFRKKRYLDIRKSLEEKLGAPLKELANEKGLHLNIRQIVDRTTRLFFSYKVKRPVLENMLSALNPKVIVEVVGGSFDAKIINEIARERGIPTMELQHGTLGPTVMYPPGVDFPQFPAYYLVFSKFWKEFARFPIAEDHVLSVGFPYFEEQVKRFNAAAKEKSSKHRTRTVVFLSSPSYGKELSEEAARFSALAGKKYHVIFKLHPKEMKDWQSRYSALKDTEVEVIDRPEESVYGIFARSDIQVGVESTAIYEGLAFSLDTFVMRLPQAYLMEELCARGFGVFVADASELMTAVENTDKTGKKDPGEFWEANAREKTVKAIRTVMGTSPKKE
ncbi:MAG: hypothetical protein K5985_04410 [Lachnospiraceae bacterium]|nr:hypothetical protein [Lachnospiraceae bacterium]